MNIGCAWKNSLQSTKSGLFKYCSLANADSWAPPKPPSNLISLLSLLLSSLLLRPSLVFGVFFPSGPSTLCHFILPTFWIRLPCNGIYISQTPQPFFLLTNWRWKESFRPAAEQYILKCSPWKFSLCTLSHTCSWAISLFPRLPLTPFLSIYPSHLICCTICAAEISRILHVLSFAPLLILAHPSLQAWPLLHGCFDTIFPRWG